MGKKQFQLLCLFKINAKGLENIFVKYSDSEAKRLLVCLIFYSCPVCNKLVSPCKQDKGIHETLLIQKQHNKLKQANKKNNKPPNKEYCKI